MNDGLAVIILIIEKVNGRIPALLILTVDAVFFLWM